MRKREKEEDLEWTSERSQKKRRVDRNGRALDGRKATAHGEKKEKFIVEEELKKKSRKTSGRGHCGGGKKR